MSVQNLIETAGSATPLVPSNITVESIKFGITDGVYDPTPLNYYEEIANSVNTTGAKVIAFNATIVRIGNTVTVRWIDSPFADALAATLVAPALLPVRVRPTVQTYGLYNVDNAATIGVGLITIQTNGDVVFAADAAGDGFTLHSNNSVRSGSFTFNIDS